MTAGALLAGVKRRHGLPRPKGFLLSSLWPKVEYNFSQRERGEKNLDRSQKQQIVTDLTAKLGQVEAIILTDFKGLNVVTISTLRRRVSEAGGRYQVVKNTLLKLAAEGTDAGKLEDLLTGNNALGMTEGDPVSLVRALVDFAKENENLVIKAGIISGRMIDTQQILDMAGLPPRDVLLGKLLGTMNAVPTNLVRVLNALTSNFVYALAAIRDQKEQA
jgi:large subunit ribosomal protein L10